LKLQRQVADTEKYLGLKQIGTKIVLSGTSPINSVPVSSKVECSQLVHSRIFILFLKYIHLDK